MSAFLQYEISRRVEEAIRTCATEPLSLKASNLPRRSYPTEPRKWSGKTRKSGRESMRSKSAAIFYAQRRFPTEQSRRQGRQASREKLKRGEGQVSSEEFARKMGISKQSPLLASESRAPSLHRQGFGVTISSASELPLYIEVYSIINRFIPPYGRSGRVVKALRLGNSPNRSGKPRAFEPHLRHHSFAFWPAELLFASILGEGRWVGESRAGKYSHWKPKQPQAFGAYSLRLTQEASVQRRLQPSLCYHRSSSPQECFAGHMV